MPPPPLDDAHGGADDDAYAGAAVPTPLPAPMPLPVAPPPIDDKEIDRVAYALSNFCFCFLPFNSNLHDLYKYINGI